MCNKTWLMYTMLIRICSKEKMYVLFALFDKKLQVDLVVEKQLV
jgi:hypothetical protein